MRFTLREINKPSYNFRLREVKPEVDKTAAPKFTLKPAKTERPALSSDSQASQESASLLDRARNISNEPKTGDMSVVPYMATRAVRGVMGPILIPAMEAVGLPKIGVDTRKTLDTAVEYWDKRVPDGAAKELIGQTAEIGDRKSVV